MSKGHYIITQELLIYWQNILLRYAGAGGGETDLSAPHVHPVDLHFLKFSKNDSLSLLGLLAKIKCSICSYQFNIWYGVHSTPCILIWFLAFELGTKRFTSPCSRVAPRLHYTRARLTKYKNSKTSSNSKIQINIQGVLLCTPYQISSWNFSQGPR